MKVINTKFKDLKIIAHKKNSDSRGFLRETFKKKIIKWDDLIFDYFTTSKKNVLRGFHFQSKFKQVKFVSVLKGKILDCVIDLRKKSKTFGKSFFIELSEKNCRSLYIPEGFAHAYYSFSDLNIIFPQCKVIGNLKSILEISKLSISILSIFFNLFINVCAKAALFFLYLNFSINRLACFIYLS